MIGTYQSTHNRASTSSKIEACPIATSCLYIVGIDFGTTQTGYSFARNPFLAADGKSIDFVTNEDWDNSPTGFIYPKAPTIVAYKKSDLNDKVFGWTAKLDIHTEDYHVVERVKLCLEDSIPDSDKPKLPPGKTVVDVITDILVWMKNAMMNQITALSTDRNLKVSEFLYCFTVPVGWSQNAHQSIRNAAFKAGLIDDVNSRKLVFCFEPEAAALACVHDAKRDGVDAPLGTTILVVDAGGGTVDMFMAKIGDSEHLEELSMSEGHYLGATLLDHGLMDTLKERLGDDAFEEFKNGGNHSTKFTDLLIRWEFIKRNFNGRSKPLLINVPRSIAALMPASKRKSLTIDGDLVLNSEAITGIFTPIVDQIADKVANYLKRVHFEFGSRIDHLYLVGGFGCNQFLRKTIANNSAIAGYIKSMVTARHPGSAVLHGATWCARDHREITSRRARETISLGIRIPFDSNCHSADDIDGTMFNVSRGLTCPAVTKFVSVFVQRGDQVSANARVVQGLNAFAMTSAWFPLYRTQKLLRPGDKGRMLRAECQEFASFGMDVGGPEWQAGMGDLTVELYYGNVEMGVNITNKATGCSKFQYLTYNAYKGNEPSKYQVM